MGVIAALSPDFFTTKNTKDTKALCGGAAGANANDGTTHRSFPWCPW
jgi:hypothetical protein